MTTTSPRLLLIHIPGADWQLAHPLVEQGMLPNLGALIERGTIGNLLTSHPRIRPALSTTLSTGTLCDSHGILAYNKPDRSSPLGLRPIQSTDLGASPMWEKVAQSGQKAISVGWPATHPATVFDATVISDVFCEAEGSSLDEWPIRADSISDPDLVEQLVEMRLHPTEVTAEMMLPFLPKGHEIDQETDERLPLLVGTLARAASVHAAATSVAEHRPWNLLAVHFDLIERLTSAFLQYRSPRMAHVTETDHRIYSGVVEGAYHFFDMLLGRYLELIDPDCSVVLASGHGYLLDDLRPTPTTANALDRVTPTYRLLGLLAAAGPGIKQDELVFGASVLDVAPTCLSLLGLPVADDMDGRVLIDVLENPTTSESASYANPDFASCCSTEPDWSLAGRRVVEYSLLKYHPLPPNDPELAFETATLRWLGNLADVQMVKREHRDALTNLQKILELFPDHGLTLQRVAQCHLELGDTIACRKTLEELLAAGHDGAILQYFFGKLCLREGDVFSANTHFDQAEDSHRGGIGGQRLLEQIGRDHLSSRELRKAELSFRKALEIDPNSTLAHNGLASALLGLRQYLEASEHFRRSLANLHSQVDAHYNLGRCLSALGRHEEAAEAFRQSLKLNPDLKAAQQALDKTERAMAKQN